MNTIGIDRCSNRARIRKLLAIGLVASILTGIGDFENTHRKAKGDKGACC